MAKSTKYFDAIKSQLGSGPVTLETIEGVKVEFKAPPAQEEKQLPINNSPEIRNDVQVVPPKGAAEIKTESQQTQVNNALIKKVKVKDDFGDDIEEEIDLGNDEKLQEYLTAKHKNKHLESELELTKGEKAALEAKAKQLSEKYSKFEGMSPEQIADTILAEKGGLESIILERMKAREEFNKLPEAEKQKIIEAQEAKKRSDAITAREKELEEKLNKLKEQEQKVKNETVTSMFRSAASKFSPNNVENKELLKVNSIIFAEAKAEIAALEKSGVTLTQSIIDQKFQKAYLNNKTLVEAAKNIGAGQTKPMNNIVEATKQVIEGINSSNASASSSVAGEVNESAILDKWYQLIIQGKGHEVDKEVATNPKLFGPLHSKLARRFIRRR